MTYYYKLLEAPKLEISFEGEIYVNEPSWYVIINNSEPKFECYLINESDTPYINLKAMLT